MGRNNRGSTKASGRAPLSVRDQTGNFLAVSKVVGVGGGGTNAVNRMVDAGFDRARVHRGQHGRPGALMCDADVKIHIGSQATRGLGAGADPVVGKAAAQESRDELKEALKGCRHGLRHGGRGRRHRHRRGADLGRAGRRGARRTHGRRGHAAVRVRGPQAGAAASAGSRISATRSTR